MRPDANRPEPRPFRPPGAASEWEPETPKEEPRAARIPTNPFSLSPTPRSVEEEPTPAAGTLNPAPERMTPALSQAEPDATPEDFSYDVQEIMTRSPHWLLRWGITVLAIIIFVLIFLTWIIRYPDTIKGTMTVTGSTPAVDVVARQSGHLSQLRFKENDPVEKGQILAVIDSPADIERVYAVKERLTG